MATTLELWWLLIPRIKVGRALHENLIIIIVITPKVLLCLCLLALILIHRCNQLLQLILLLRKKVLRFGQIWLRLWCAARELW